MCTWIECEVSLADFAACVLDWIVCELCLVSRFRIFLAFAKFKEE
jgi:hypothetical protein